MPFPSGRARRTWEWVVRHPCLAAFLLAFGIRALAASLINLKTGGTLVPDDRTYHDIAIDVAKGDTDRWDERTRFLHDVTTTFVGPLSLVYTVVGPVRLAGQLLAAAFGAAAAAGTARIALFAQPPGWAFAAGAVVALLPSQVLWSSLTLKDSAVWAVLALVGVAVAYAVRTGGRRALVAGLVVVGLLLLLSRLRDHTLMVSLIALVMASWIVPGSGRAPRACSALAALLLVPWVVGLGPAGVDFARGTGSLEQRRIDNAAGANSALVQPEPASSGPATPSKSAPAGATAPPPETEASGGGATAPPAEAEVSADLAHLPRGVLAMVAEPFPFGSQGSTALQLARLESLVWYPVLLLAALGVGTAWRRRSTYAWPVLTGAGICLLYALAEGNLGTAFRHRGEFVWVVALLAALGAEGLLGCKGSGANEVEAYPMGPELDDADHQQARAERGA